MNYEKISRYESIKKLNEKELAEFLFGFVNSKFGEYAQFNSVDRIEKWLKENKRGDIL